MAATTRLFPKPLRPRGAAGPVTSLRDDFIFGLPVLPNGQAAREEIGN
jgi:hypothetical protein